VIGRVLEVKEQLTDLNRKVSFINLDDVLVDLKLSPAVLEVPVPHFFIEDQATALEEREKLLDVLLQQAGLDDKRKTGREQREDIMTLESALRVVQLNERGRQGRQRAKFMKEIRMQEERERRIMSKGADEHEPEYAAVTIQQNWRGFICRKKTDIMRAEELIFIGMAPPPPHPKEKDPLVREQDVKKRRKLIQAQHEEEYRNALVTLDKQVFERLCRCSHFGCCSHFGYCSQVFEHEGPDMKEEMMDQLRDWCARHARRRKPPQAAASRSLPAHRVLLRRPGTHTRRARARPQVHQVPRARGHVP